MRRQLVADPVRPPHGDHRVGDLEREPGAVFEAAAVRVAAVVGAVAQELIEQVAIRAVQFDAVEAGGLGVLGGGAELRDDRRQFVQFQRARRRDLDLAVVRKGFAFDRQRRRGDRQRAVVEVRMRDAADMPELREDAAARLVDRLGHLFPAGDLRRRVHARGADIADALRADLGGLGDDQPGGRALGVVGRGQRVRHIAVERPAARHRRQDQPVLELEIAKPVGGEQRLRSGGGARGVAVAQGGGFDGGHDGLLTGGTDKSA